MLRGLPSFLVSHAGRVGLRARRTSIIVPEPLVGGSTGLVWWRGLGFIMCGRVWGGWWGVKGGGALPLLEVRRALIDVVGSFATAGLRRGHARMRGLTRCAALFEADPFVPLLRVGDVVPRSRFRGLPIRLLGTEGG